MVKNEKQWNLKSSNGSHVQFSVFTLKLENHKITIITLKR